MHPQYLAIEVEKEVEVIIDLSDSEWKDCSRDGHISTPNCHIILSTFLSSTQHTLYKSHHKLNWNHFLTLLKSSTGLEKPAGQSLNCQPWPVANTATTLSQSFGLSFGLSIRRYLDLTPPDSIRLMYLSFSLGAPALRFSSIVTYVLFSKKSAAFILEMMPERALGTMMIGGRESLAEDVLPLAAAGARLLPTAAGDSPVRCFLLLPSLPSLPVDPLDGSTGAAAADFVLCASGFRICSLNSFKAKEKSCSDKQNNARNISGIMVSNSTYEE